MHKAFPQGRAFFCKSFNKTKMKTLYRFLPFLLLGILTVSCIRIDDDDFLGGHFYNEGQVTFDGLTIPLDYADFYKRANVEGGEIWVLELSEEFLGYGHIHSDAYLYMEVFRPYGSSLEGVYDMLHPARTIDYVAYYEDAVFYDGILNSYGFQIPNNVFVDGRLRVEVYSGNTHYFEVRLQTYDGKLLTAYFEGQLQY